MDGYKRVAFFHGLTSGIQDAKKLYLEQKFDYVYYPKLDYFHDKTIFIRMLSEIKERDIDLLIGSSMGGWIAYAISTQTGLPCILFNPALANEGDASSYELHVAAEIGTQSATKHILLGKNDDVIDFRTTESYLSDKELGEIYFSYGNHAHRTDIDAFVKMIAGVIT